MNTFKDDCIPLRIFQLQGPGIMHCTVITSIKQATIVDTT